MASDEDTPPKSPEPGSAAGKEPEQGKHGPREPTSSSDQPDLFKLPDFNKPAEPDVPGLPGPADPTQHPAEGSVTFQDAATTKPRPPKPAELRARQKFAEKQREIEEARLAAEAKRKKRNRTLIGAGAGVGVVGVVAGLGYWALSTPTTYAQCVRDDPRGQPVIVQDSYCTGHTAGSNGFFFFGGHQYRYYYGSSGSIGSRPIGGSTTAPSGSTIKTRSGSTISRGGLGGKFGGGGS